MVDLFILSSILPHAIDSLSYAMDSGPGSCVVDGHENDNEIQETKKLIMEENGEIYMVNGRGLYITITALNEQWCSKIFITTR